MVEESKGNSVFKQHQIKHSLHSMNDGNFP